jgi:large subunit ribosomal protein L29
MKADKLREQSDDELKHQEKETAEQLFRLRITMSSGQTEGIAKYRSLKKDYARIKTIRGQRQEKK